MTAKGDRTPGSKRADGATTLGVSKPVRDMVKKAANGRTMNDFLRDVAKRELAEAPKEQPVTASEISRFVSAMLSMPLMPWLKPDELRREIEMGATSLDDVEKAAVEATTRQVKAGFAKIRQARLPETTGMVRENGL